MQIEDFGMNETAVSALSRNWLFAEAKLTVIDASRFVKGIRVAVVNHIVLASIMRETAFYTTRV